MEKEKYSKKRIAVIWVEPYLAEYARKKFQIDPKSGGVKIPDTFDLYHCIWNRMQKPSPESVNGEDAPQASDGNLRIFLPCRRSGAEGQPRKHPEYWNYLSPAAVIEIEKCLRQLFNFDFHQRMMDNENRGRPFQQVEVVDRFIYDYRLESVTTAALLKNFQRYRQRLSPRKPRKYQKVARV